MGKTGAPRHGSMQYWPRVRAKRQHPRVNAYPAEKEVKALGFAGYKVGMTHVGFVDNKATSPTKGKTIVEPVTIIECPPLKIASICFYKTTDNKNALVSEHLAKKLDKELARTMTTPKNIKSNPDQIEFDEIRLKVHTQPKLVGLQKKPEVFEIPLGGKKEEQLAFAKEKLGTEIPVTEVFEEGNMLDCHAVTKGKGNQGPVKRFGVNLREKKSEKTKRGPGSLGGWIAQGHTMYRMAFSGQMGYHKRTEHNKWLIKIGTDPKEVNPKGGFLRFGEVKNSYMLIKGSIPGPSKRLIRFNKALRTVRNMPKEAPQVTYISTESRQ